MAISYRYKVKGFTRKSHLRAKPGAKKKTVKIASTKVKGYKRFIPSKYKKY